MLQCNTVSFEKKIRGDKTLSIQSKILKLIKRKIRYSCLSCLIVCFFFLNVAFFQRRKIYNIIDERYYSCYFGVKKRGNFKWNYNYFKLSDQ